MITSRQESKQLDSLDLLAMGMYGSYGWRLTLKQSISNLD